MLQTYWWWLVIVGSWGPRSSSLVAGVSSTRGRDWSLPQLSHERQILLVHSRLVLGWLRRLTTCCSMGSKGATPSKTTNSVTERFRTPSKLRLLWTNQLIITWCTCSQRRCGLLHHTWYRGWYWWCCVVQHSAKDEGSYRDKQAHSLFSAPIQLKLTLYEHGTWDIL